VRSTDDGVHDAVVPILVDGSRSMSIEDAGGRRRIESARELITKSLLPALTPVFSVDVLSFGDDVSPTAPEGLNASGRRSDLAAALSLIKERYRGRPIAGIVLVSD